MTKTLRTAAVAAFIVGAVVGVGVCTAVNADAKIEGWLERKTKEAKAEQKNDDDAYQRYQDDFTTGMGRF